MHQLPSSHEGGTFTSEGDSLLRSKLSGGDTLLRSPGGTLLCSKVSGGHFTTGGSITS